MKRIVKKNQIVLTVLAVMIAVAGYLTYAGNDGLLPVGTQGEAGETEGDGQEVLEDQVLQENEGALKGEAQEGDEETEEAPLPDDTPGQSVLTGADVVDFMAKAALSREQVRTKNKEALMEIINSTGIEEDQKQAAVDAMVELTDLAQKENATETLLAAKGFENTVVSINEQGVDVVIGRAELSDAERAQIEDIVKRKAEVEAKDIVITLMTQK